MSSSSTCDVNVVVAYEILRSPGGRGGGGGA